MTSLPPPIQPQIQYSSKEILKCIFNSKRHYRSPRARGSLGAADFGSFTGEKSLAVEWELLVETGISGIGRDITEQHGIAVGI
jgi:hypothetical protein